MGTFSGNQCRQNWWEEMLRCPNFGVFFRQLKGNGVTVGSLISACREMFFRG